MPSHTDSASPPVPQPRAAEKRKRSADAGTPPPLRKKGCGFGSVLLAMVLLLGGGAAWFFTQQFRLERAAFERVRHSESVAEIERFLSTRMYMPEEHRRAAEARIARLQSDSADFVAATTVEACEHYLTIHSDGKHVEEVQARLARLRRERPSRQLEPDSLGIHTPISNEATNRTATDTTAQTAPQRVATTESAPARYHVIAASFANYDTATLRAAELRGKGYSAYVMEAQTAEGRVYRVVVASYSDPTAAGRTAQALRRDCPDAWVMAK